MSEILTDADVRFINSGSTLLDLALGGGWAIPRIFNLVGDKSSGKTLLAIESFANFSRAFPDGRMRYAEAESAFDEVYASILGFPKNVTKPADGMLTTVQEFQEDLKKFVAEGIESKTPGLYILDSLDALSDDAEVKEFFREKKPDEDPKGSYGMSKPKEMSKLFRVLTQEIEKSNTSLGIISQIRDNISTFPMRGESKTRSGGHALDFYSSQIVWLREIDKLKRVYLGEERTIGIEVEAVVKKNKVGFPFRTAKFPIIFAYGVDDEQSILDWLKLRGQITGESSLIFKKRLHAAREKKDYVDLKAIKSELVLDACRVWAKIQDEMAPPVRKYAEELR
jgi:RecA/RadA recombinase